MPVGFFLILLLPHSRENDVMIPQQLEPADRYRERMQCASGEEMLGRGEEMLQKEGKSWGEGPGSDSPGCWGHRKTVEKQRADSKLGNRWQVLLPEQEEPTEERQGWEAIVSCVHGEEQLGSHKWLAQRAEPAVHPSEEQSGGGPRVPMRHEVLEPRGTGQGRVGTGSGKR